MNEKILNEYKNLKHKCILILIYSKLLGNNSSKTTKIYTHVSKKGIDKIINPMIVFFD